MENVCFGFEGDQFYINIVRFPCSLDLFILFWEADFPNFFNTCVELTAFWTNSQSWRKFIGKFSLKSYQENITIRIECRLLDGNGKRAFTGTIYENSNSFRLGLTTYGV